MHWQCDRCGADYELSKQHVRGAFMAAWGEAIRNPLPTQREIRLPLSPEQLARGDVYLAALREQGAHGGPAF
jgi:hypothetical protein